MTLTAFHLARFKAFADSQRIPIRPITLIFGANSAGKSSIIHALALAHLTQRSQVAPVLVAARQVKQQVLDRADAALGERLGPSGADARHVLHVVKSKSHVVMA